MNPRILLLEDDPAIAGTVAFALQHEGFAVDHVLLVGAARTSVATAAPRLAIELDADGQRIRFAAQWLGRTRLEFGLLRALLRTPGRIRSREALLDEVWGADGDATDRTVDTHVKTLRAKLRALRPELEPIATHRGTGYSLALAVPPTPNP